MEILDRVVPNNFNLFLFGDTHHGAVHCHEDGLDEMIETMQGEYEGCKHNVGVHHGDAVEAITCDDSRFYHESEDPNLPTPIHQARYAADKLLPIKDKLCAFLIGNHEEKHLRLCNLTKDVILERLGKEHIYGTKSCVIRYIDRKGELLFKHYAHHGFGSISSVADDPERQQSNMKLSLKRKLKNKFADCVLRSMGHTHKLMVCNPTSQLYITTEGDTVKQGYTVANHADEYIHPDNAYYVNTGSFLKLYMKGFSGYAESFGYDPVQLGYAVAIVRDREIQEIKMERLE